MKKSNEAKGISLLIGYVGIVMIMIGIIIMIPLLMLIFYKEETIYAKNFIFPGCIFILIGYIMNFSFSGKTKARIGKNQDLQLVLLIWIITILGASIPMLLTKKYSFIQCVFEAASGFSTTGLSIVDVENTPHIFLFFRSIMQFFGGVGLVLIMTSVISDRYGMRLYNAEGHTDRLLPNLVKSARMIMVIYLGYITIGTVLYVIFGMSLFDAINHSISAVSTGGFSTKSNSIGYYNSISIEIITIGLMLLGSTNFLIHLALMKRKFISILKHSETKFLVITMFFGVALFTFLFMSVLNLNFQNGLRYGIFQFTSAITTTGYQTIENFTLLSSNLLGFMVLLMLVGGGIGSTAGGIKQYRIVLFFKSIYWGLLEKITNKKIIRPHTINKVGQKAIIGVDEISGNYNFIGLYLLIFLIGTMIIASFGFSLEHSMFEFASALGTVGLSVGITSANNHPIILMTLISGMILGRLEIYIIFDVLIRTYRTIVKKEVL